MLGKKRQVFREDLYLPKHQLKKVKRGEVVTSHKKSFPWLALFLWFCFVGTFVYMLLFSPVMNVEVLHVEGNSRVTQSDVEKYFAEEREGVFGFVLKRQNFFLFRTGALRNRLQQELPAIENVRVEKEFPNKVNIFIEERQIAVLWCSRGPCSLVRNDSVAAEGANVPDKKGNLPLYTIVDTGGLPVTLGEKIFDYPFVEYFRENVQLLQEEFGIAVKNEATSASRFSDEVRFSTETGYELLLSMRFDPHQNMKFLHLFFDQEFSLERQGELKSIDLRTENRIYYALKNSNPEDAAEEVKTDQEKKEDTVNDSSVKQSTEKKDNKTKKSE